MRRSLAKDFYTASYFKPGLLAAESLSLSRRHYYTPSNRVTFQLNLHKNSMCTPSRIQQNKRTVFTDNVVIYIAPLPQLAIAVIPT